MQDKEIAVDEKPANFILSRLFITEGKYTQAAKYILALIFSALILKSVHDF